VRKVIGTLLLVAALSVAAGCGGSDSSSDATTATGSTTTASSTTPPTPTKAQFIQEADQICDSDSEILTVKLAAYEQRAKQTGRPEEEVFEEFAEDVLLPTVETRLEKLHALGLPSKGKQEAEAFFDAMEKGVSAAQQNSASTLAEFEKPFDPAIKLGRAFGFKRCAR
jgi:hypothetical protein